ncbi:Hypothetical predicted protein [Octopus vulgaris]|uniref:Uncharacterized protein n=1 Tax=Octopus vulgaris TaxID=6645 RepID=A0AA36B419_OCTVU|nr:Hypothetical predicted protein [Octopus vulgaris]
MSPKRESKELNCLLQAWMIACGDPPNSTITAALKNNGFCRTIDQIQWKKNEFIRSYAFIRPHIDTLDVIMENYCGKADKDMENETKNQTSL